jgi:hypothetical protein
MRIFLLQGIATPVAEVFPEQKGNLTLMPLIGGHWFRPNLKGNEAKLRERKGEELCRHL